MITEPKYPLTVELIVFGRGTYADNEALSDATIAEVCAWEALYPGTNSTWSLATRAFSAARRVLEPTNFDGSPRPRSSVVDAWLDRFHQANATRIESSNAAQTEAR